MTDNAHDATIDDLFSLSDAQCMSFFHLDQRHDQDIDDAHSPTNVQGSTSPTSRNYADENASATLLTANDRKDDDDEDQSNGEIDVFKPLPCYNEESLVQTLQATSSTVAHSLEGMWAMMEQCVQLVYEHNQRQWEEIHQNVECGLADLRAFEAEQEMLRSRLSQFVTTVRSAFHTFVDDSQLRTASGV